MISKKLRRQIEGIPGENGWWHASGRDSFESIAESLLEFGLNEIEVFETLESAYAAVANEFGL